MDPCNSMHPTNLATSSRSKTMESTGEVDAAKLLGAQAHIWNHIFGFIKSMSLKCAVDLNIPDVIHKYGQPMPLSQLIASLPIHPTKTTFIHRLMRILARSGLFSQQNGSDNELEVRYALTDASRLLLKDHPFSMSLFPDFILDPSLVKPWYQLSNWFKNDDPTPFQTEHGMTFWEYAGHEPKLRHMFYDAMTCDSRLVSSVVVDKCKGVFEGLESLVDVGGSTGTMAKAMAEPQMECIVFDLPHVVAGLQVSENLKYVGGDMFDARAIIPPVDAVLLKWVLHDWNDAECVEILKKCKEAVVNKGKKGKVIIIDIVMGNEMGDKELLEAQLFHDMEMMVTVIGKERNEKEWAKLIFSAGFSNYKITPILSLRSLIELYP